ncbi:MAG: DNA alkylation repair protein [Nocardioidaceae bacterium]
MGDDLTAEVLVAGLRAESSAPELAKVRQRLGPDEEAFGLRMGTLFEIAKRHTNLPLAEVDRLLDHPAYEPRLAAFCVLDFKARRRLSDEQRRELYDLYLGRHDRITTWDMVDRSAPRVVGGHLSGRSAAPLHELAGSPDPLRRRTAMTAPLDFVMSGSDADVAEGFAIAATLATDPDPVVHKPVGIFLKHASDRDRDAVESFLATHARSMPRPAVRLAAEKLAPTTRARYVP